MEYLDGSDDLDDFFTKKIDMMHRRCSCGEGTFKEMTLQDDWIGILHCNVCNKSTKRYVLLSDYRELQINKILE